MRRWIRSQHPLRAMFHFFVAFPIFTGSLWFSFAVFEGASYRLFREHGITPTFFGLLLITLGVLLGVALWRDHLVAILAVCSLNAGTYLTVAILFYFGAGFRSTATSVYLGLTGGYVWFMVVYFTHRLQQRMTE